MISPVPRPLSTDEINGLLREGLDRTEVPVATLRGEAEATLSTSAQVVEAEYSVPLRTVHEADQLHSRVHWERTTLWIGTQAQDVVRMTLENAMQVQAEQLFINTTYLGGGFGRKTHGEIALQAALASRVGTHGDRQCLSVQSVT